MAVAFEKTFKYKLIYVMSINDPVHKGLLKIGEASIGTDKQADQLPCNCSDLNKAAKERINSYTGTAGISYDLLYTQLAIRQVKTDEGNLVLEAFGDTLVHEVLKNSGFKKQKIGDTAGTEWFKVTLDLAKKAIQAVIDSRRSLKNTDVADGVTPVIFRPEQEIAIKETVSTFKKGDRMLWNAKMRFGKTLCALQVVKEMNFGKTIIITHRPVVDEGWFKDFHKIFYNNNNFAYGSKNFGENFIDLLAGNKNFVYFASMQDLRGSNIVGGQYSKNSDVFAAEWDCVIVDEAHEGTTTILGEDVLTKIFNEGKTKFLALSGTPFNIIDKYESNIYTWDYVMEQRSKKEWNLKNFGDSNPYEDLPEMRIFTYDLGALRGLKHYCKLEDKAFNFREFFRTWTSDISIDNEAMPADKNIGDFVHEDDVNSFLDLISTPNSTNNYPYSNQQYQELFRHTLWVVPGVKEAKALKNLLEKHQVFRNFKIVNVAGNDGEEASNALNSVCNAIKTADVTTGYTITISCGKLTTGVTIREWTAVLMLSGTSSTSAANYLQTIFRVQSPCNKYGKTKQNCYVFDFAPDRTLKMVADAVAVSTKAGHGTGTDKKIMGEFLNYCPVISFSGTQMQLYNADKLLQQLKRAYAERVIRNGFDDNNLYNDNLLKLTGVDLQDFSDLKKIIGSSKASAKTSEIDINHQGFTDEEYKIIEKIKKKKKKNLTPEEQAKLDELKKKRKQKYDAISILRAISIRMPLLIYGANINVDDNFTLDMFLDRKIVDESSWNEFMPPGVTQAVFKKFKKYYDEPVLIAAGKAIRTRVKDADELPPLERIKVITELFSLFKNPDKETVLTPWRVVNIHMSNCMGGYDFYDQNHGELLLQPRKVDKGDVSKLTVFNKDAQILEINSKSGLYPLYFAYSIYKTKCSDYNENSLSLDDKQRIWAHTIEKNIFAVCRTEMAKLITKRTLLGYNDYPINAHCFKHLIEHFTSKKEQIKNKLLKQKTWKLTGSVKMKFNAVVGNPPYQQNISESGDNASLSKQLFPLFIQNAINLDTRYVSLITPSRWFTADAQDKSFIKLREFVKKHNHFAKIFNYPDNKLLFKGVEIAGGVNYFLYDNQHNGNVEFNECYDSYSSSKTRPLFENDLDIILSMNDLVSIVEKVRTKLGFKPMTEITSGRNAFGVVGKKDILEKNTKTTPFDGSIPVRCAYEQIRYIKRDAVTKSVELIDKYKVFTSKGNGGAGVLTDNKPVSILGKPYLGEKGSVCTDSLIPIGSFDQKDDAENLQKYMKTKFFRFMVGVLKVSQNVYQNVYQFVPIQNFTNNSDIDWSLSISDIDKLLYSKYDLSNDDVLLIESKIKLME